MSNNLIKYPDYRLNEDALLFKHDYIQSKYNIYDGKNELLYQCYFEIKNGDIMITDHSTVNTICYLLSCLCINDNDYIITKQTYLEDGVYRGVFNVCIKLIPNVLNWELFTNSLLILNVMYSEKINNIHLKYLKLYRLLRFKNVAESIFHPDNIDFKI